jgi:hypothetical protein
VGEIISPTSFFSSSAVRLDRQRLLVFRLAHGGAHPPAHVDRRQVAAIDRRLSQT